MHHEIETLKALESLKILDSLPKNDFDDLTLLASQICDTPIALVSLVDESRQWFKSRHGLSASHTACDFAFFSQAVSGDDLFIVSDCREDERFFDDPLVAGSPHVVFYAGVPLTLPDGYPIGTLCVIDHKPRTLSEKQKAALKAVSRQICRLFELGLQIEIRNKSIGNLEYKKTAIQNLTEGVVLQDAAHKIVEFNSAALDVLGLTADQLTGKTSMDLDWQAIREDGSPFPGNEHPSVVAVTTGRKQKAVLMGIRRPDSELRWIEINSTPIFSTESPTPSFSVTSFSDITFERNAELIIEKNQAHLKRVLNGVPALIGHWSRNLINLNANNTYSEYFGKTPEEIVGKPIQFLLGEELFQKNHPYIKKVLNGEPQLFEREISTPGGRIRHTLANYLPEFENGKVVGFFVIVTDLTELKRLEGERQALASKMIESAKLSSLGEMAGGVAHEINTPLAVIYTKTSMLLESYSLGRGDDQETIKQLQKIKVTADRITKIVKGLRSFSRNSDNDPMESFSIPSVVEATLDLCQEKLVHSQVTLIKEIEDNIQISGKFSEISQVLMNLISNSIDATALLPEKWIRIQCVRQNEQCVLSVTDSGKGIPDHILEKMMNPFFTTKEIGKGIGLGLSISSGIIAAHGGRIWCDTQSPNTRFVVEIPIINSDNKDTVA